ncbi:MAG: hypothetical protein DMG57_10025 [Acidobacteria bacterium]|nr:MAG: hypothetical protein DMG57_10025 [Acidobacteriota bacterium]
MPADAGRCRRGPRELRPWDKPGSPEEAKGIPMISALDAGTKQFLAEPMTRVWLFAKNSSAG